MAPHSPFYLISPSLYLSPDASPLPLQLRRHPRWSTDDLPLIPPSSTPPPPPHCLRHSSGPCPITHVSLSFPLTCRLGRLRSGRSLWPRILSSSSAVVAWAIRAYNTGDILRLRTTVSNQFWWPNWVLTSSSWPLNQNVTFHSWRKYSNCRYVFLYKNDKLCQWIWAKWSLILK